MTNVNERIAEIRKQLANQNGGEYNGIYAKGYYCSETSIFHGTIFTNGNGEQVNAPLTFSLQKYTRNAVTSANGNISSIQQDDDYVLNMSIGETVLTTINAYDEYTGDSCKITESCGQNDNAGRRQLVNSLPSNFQSQPSEEPGPAEKQTNLVMSIAFAVAGLKSLQARIMKQNASAEKLVLTLGQNERVKFLLSPEVSKHFTSMTRDTFNKNFVNQLKASYSEHKEKQPQNAGSATAKILYKGYYYKIRTEGRKKFILTKKEGQVSLADAKKWLKKNKKP
jgi:hypothetical protein